MESMCEGIWGGVDMPSATVSSIDDAAPNLATLLGKGAGPALTQSNTGAINADQETLNAIGTELVQAGLRIGMKNPRFTESGTGMGSP